MTTDRQKGFRYGLATAAVVRGHRAGSVVLRGPRRRQRFPAHAGGLATVAGQAIGGRRRQIQPGRQARPQEGRSLEWTGLGELQFRQAARSRESVPGHSRPRSAIIRLRLTGSANSIWRRRRYDLAETYLLKAAPKGAGSLVRAGAALPAPGQVRPGRRMGRQGGGFGSGRRYRPPNAAGGARQTSARTAAISPRAAVKKLLIGICVSARPLVLGAARVKEHCVSLSFIAAPSWQAWRRASGFDRRGNGAGPHAKRGE